MTKEINAAFATIQNDLETRIAKAGPNDQWELRNLGALLTIIQNHAFSEEGITTKAMHKVYGPAVKATADIMEDEGYFWSGYLPLAGKPEDEPPKYAHSATNPHKV